MHMPIARKRLDKHIPEVALSVIEAHSSLSNEAIKKPFLLTEYGVFRGVRAEEL
jgi:hypothetical protein